MILLKNQNSSTVTNFDHGLDFNFQKDNEFTTLFYVNKKYAQYFQLIPQIISLIHLK